MVENDSERQACQAGAVKHRGALRSRSLCTSQGCASCTPGAGRQDAPALIRMRLALRQPSMQPSESSSAPELAARKPDVGTPAMPAASSLARSRLMPRAMSSFVHSQPLSRVFLGCSGPPLSGGSCRHVGGQAGAKGRIKRALTQTTRQSGQGPPCWPSNAMSWKGRTAAEVCFAGPL